VLQDAEINNGAQVVDVGQEDNLDTSLQKLVENARVVQRLENITVARGVPLVDGRVVVLRDGQERVLVDSGVSGLVEGKDVDVVALVLLDDGSSVVICVERVHKDEGNVNVVCAVEVLDLSHRKVEEGHAITDLNDGLGTNTTHGGSQTTVELENSQLVEELDRLGVGKILVVDDLTLSGRGNAIPVSIILSANCRSWYISWKEAYTALPLALSLRYRRNRAKKLSISVSKSWKIWLALTDLENPHVSIGDLPSSARGP
jgi:hypothetical protein